MNFGPDESMDDDEIDEDEDAEMDFGEDAGSEDTSRTDEDDDMGEEDDEVDVDDETGESEGGWQDEEDDEADLVENGEEGEGDEDGDEDDEDEEVDDGVIWPEVCMPRMHLPSGNSLSHRESSKFREKRMRVMMTKELEVPHNPAVISPFRAEVVVTGAPVILGEEEEEDEDEEWTSPQDGYVSGLEPWLILTLVF